MRPTTTTPLLPVPLATALLATALLLAGCKDKAGDTATAGGPQAPVVNYWSLIAPLVAGSYAGQCLRPPDPAPFAGPIVVKQDGKASGGGLNGDLRKADISLASMNEGGEQTAAMNAVLGDFSMMLADKGAQRGLTSMVASGDKVVACEQDMRAPALRGLNIYPFIASLVDTPRREIDCIPTGALTSGKLAFMLDKGILSLGEERFELTASRQQSALFTDGLSKLFYSATLADGRMIKLQIDEHGKLAGVEGKGRDGQLYACK
ncbi:MAG TPA: hypothetical protein VGC21_14595 [Telluria sp.]